MFCCGLDLPRCVPLPHHGTGPAAQTDKEAPCRFVGSPPWPSSRRSSPEDCPPVAVTMVRATRPTAPARCSASASPSRNTSCRPTPTRPRAARSSTRLFAGPLDYDKEGKPLQLIADSITSADSKVWTIKLKDGFTFHNGEKVTSDSFINAWNYGAYGPNASDVNGFFDQIAGYADLQTADGKGTPKSEETVRPEEGRRPDLHGHADRRRSSTSRSTRLHRVLPDAGGRVRGDGPSPRTTSRPRSATAPSR